MNYLIGTSGYNYPEWRGSFYPEKFPTSKMLAFYAEHFKTVEVNYTFYRMPTPALLEGWAKGTPEPFKFTLKAPRRITHDSKLQRCEDLTQVFCKTAATLGSKLGVLLFQLPPTFKRDDAVFGSFLDLIPEGTRAASSFGTRRGMTTRSSRRSAAESRAMRGRQREDEHTGRDDRRLCVFPPA